jgi:DNA-binding response OmpR family regulator
MSTELTRFESKILETLKAKEGETVTREEINRALYPDGSILPESNGIEVFVRRLRTKLGDTAEITTVRGLGYKLERKEVANVE